MGMLPEEMFDLIFERLPYAAQCHFRCLCWKWKGFQSLSLPPSCTIMSNAGNRNARFCCDSQRKWFSLPSNGHAPSGQAWEVIDADAGLVCYQCNINGRFWFWVCNPLNPSLSRLIRPTNEMRDPRTWAREAPRTKLLVHRAKKTYKIVSKLDQLPSTAVYDSTTSRWKVMEYCSPYIVRESLEFFMWGNVPYAYNTEKKLTEMHTCLAAFSMKRRLWISIQMQIPCEVGFPTKRYLLSNNDRVMLVLYSYRKQPRPYFSVWKLLDRSSNFAPTSLCKLKNWEKVEIGSERAMVDLRGHRLAGASYGAEHFCFILKDDHILPDGSRGYKCVRYSLKAKSWSVVPCLEDCGETFQLYNWEPSMDIDPS